MLGRLVDSAGVPIAWARVKGAKEYIVPEADGSFQAEITRSSTLKVENKDITCTVRIPDDAEFLYEAGDVECLSANNKS